MPFAIVPCQFVPYAGTSAQRPEGPYLKLYPSYMHTAHACNPHLCKAPQLAFVEYRFFPSLPRSFAFRPFHAPAPVHVSLVVESLRP